MAVEIFFGLWFVPDCKQNRARAAFFLSMNTCGAPIEPSEVGGYMKGKEKETNRKMGCSILKPVTRVQDLRKGVFGVLAQPAWCAAHGTGCSWFSPSGVPATNGRQRPSYHLQAGSPGVPVHAGTLTAGGIANGGMPRASTLSGTILDWCREMGLAPGLVLAVAYGASGLPRDLSLDWASRRWNWPPFLGRTTP